MPGSKDFAALPTNWALTLWDVAPLFLSFEAAFAILAVTLLSNPLRSVVWSERKLAIPGGIAVLTLASVPLALLFAVASLVALFIGHRIGTSARPQSSASGDSTAPASPIRATTSHLGDLLAPMLIAAAVASLIKVILDPFTDWPGIAWTLLAVPTALVLPGGPGIAAIAAGGFSYSPGGIPAAAVLVLTSTTLAIFRARGFQVRSSAGEPADA